VLSVNNLKPSLDDETVVVTGASSGIGAACATLFASHGARIVLMGRDLRRLDLVRAGMRPSSVSAVADIRDRRSVEEAFAKLPSPFDHPTVLINAAGIAFGRDPLQSGSVDDWDDVIKTNINGTMYCIHAVIPGMVARGRGHVFNIGSIGGVYPQPGVGVYGGSKAFLHQITLNLRADLLGTGVRATVIEPGTTRTGFHRVRFRGDVARAESLYEGFEPLSAEDVALSVLWCFSQPPHVNINIIELMPTMQAHGQFVIHRSSDREA